LLKKVAIAAAATTAGILALSPLAFADDVVDEQVCSAEATSAGPFGNFPEPLTTILNGNIESCKDFSFPIPR
jgi:hypothetical protein